MTDASAYTVLTPSDEELQAELNAEVAKLARKGYVLVTHNQGLAIMTKKRRIGIFWNVVLSIITCGVWLIVIAIRLINRRGNTVTVSITRDRRVRVQ